MPHTYDETLTMARRIASLVDEKGGRTYYVGGYVRDQLRGVGSKDVDIEVHGIAIETLRDILRSLGELTEIGASFGIFGLKHYELDIALPRSETAAGRGHRDFDVSVDPMLGEKKAAMRRDFTINALMQDVLTGEILDFFGGQKDLCSGVIRHVNTKTFTEDPLRVLRAAQFAARFEFTIAPETTELCRAIDLSALVPERIYGELKKAMLKSSHPSVFFETARQFEALDVWFPEVKALIDATDVDAWRHTMSVLDAAGAFRTQTDEPFILMLAALCHDFGKAVSTHRVEDGVALAERFL